MNLMYFLSLSSLLTLQFLLKSSKIRINTGELWRKQSAKYLVSQKAFSELFHLFVFAALTKFIFLMCLMAAISICTVESYYSQKNKQKQNITTCVKTAKTGCLVTSANKTESNLTVKPLPLLVAGGTAAGQPRTLISLWASATLSGAKTGAGLSR